MKKFALPLALLFAAACSESTTSPAASDSGLTPSYTKPGSGGGGVAVAGTLQNATFTFGAGNYTATSSGIATTTISVGDDIGTVSASGAFTSEMPKQPGDYVLGQLSNQQVTVSVDARAKNYAIDFDFYAIGSWDGQGQQAQHGNFGQDSWQVAAVCGGNLVDIFTTDFSNQKTVQQSFPLSIFAGGGRQYTSGSTDVNYTGFPTNIPQFTAVADARYHLSFIGLNPCGSLTFTGIKLLIPGFDLQSRYDESWAVDNLTLKTDS